MNSEVDRLIYEAESKAKEIEELREAGRLARLERERKREIADRIFLAFIVTMIAAAFALFIVAWPA